MLILETFENHIIVIDFINFIKDATNIIDLEKYVNS